MQKNREQSLNSIHLLNKRCVIYVMSRDQRVKYNHALFLAQKTALKVKLPLIVVFNLYPNVRNRAFQHYAFMLQGLTEVVEELTKLNIQFEFNFASGLEQVISFIKSLDPAKVYFDMSPLRGPREMQKIIADELTCACTVVDTHNIVPVWEASDKEEYAARTIRTKINQKLESYLATEIQLIKHPFGKANNNFNLDDILTKVAVPKLPNYNHGFIPGHNQALRTLERFVNNSEKYHEDRNDPIKDSLSNLSPYLHFGQISSQEIINKVKKSNMNNQSQEAFFEELIIRKELSDNFCYYNSNYDNFSGLKDWAKQTLTEHLNDKREYLYSYKQLEQAKTHDAAWNAAQLQMTRTGKMHGYMRMYWAKKFLEWTEHPEEAINYAIKLNDKYELDGYDPNGYVGILWSIGGLHDRAWFERPVYGKIRYMNYNGLKRKFKIEYYISKFNHE